MSTAASVTSPATTFGLRCLGLGALLIALSRVSVFERDLIAPLTRLQGTLAVALVGAPAVPIAVTSACSASDAIAICVAAIAAYPASLRNRVLGAAGGVVALLAANVLRIGTLGLVAGTSAFDALHSYVWPAVLILIATGYVIVWTTLATGTQGTPAAPRWALPQTARLSAFVLVFVPIYLAASPLYLHSVLVTRLATLLAAIAAWLLASIGIDAHAAGATLSLTTGRFVVTPECLMTPVLPVYLAAVCTYSRTVPRLVAAIAATLPLFTVLGLIRILAVALPTPAGLPLAFLIHAFFQLLIAAGAVCFVAYWRRPRSAAWQYAAGALAFGAVFVALLGPFMVGIASRMYTSELIDSQGALVFLPVFQIGFYVAIWLAGFSMLGWRRFLAGLALVSAAQALGYLMIETFGQAGVLVHVREIRAFAVAGPLAALALVYRRVPPHR